MPADAAAFTLLKEQLVEVLDTLTDREQKVLRLRFGLDDGRARSHRLKIYTPFDSQTSQQL